MNTGDVGTAQSRGSARLALETPDELKLARQAWLEELDCHRIVELDANIYEVGTADRVDPERPPDLARQLVRQRRVEKIEERLGAHLRQFLAGSELDPQTQILLGDPR